jgi:hypothetical protein
MWSKIMAVTEIKQTTVDVRVQDNTNIDNVKDFSSKVSTEAVKEAPKSGEIKSATTIRTPNPATPTTSNPQALTIELKGSPNNVRFTDSTASASQVTQTNVDTKVQDNTASATASATPTTTSTPSTAPTAAVAPTAPVATAPAVDKTPEKVTVALDPKNSFYNDVLGVPTDVTGTDGKNYIKTGKGNDVVIGDPNLSPNDVGDVINTGDGDDFIMTGTGVDVTNAGKGNDQIIDFGGGDVIDAGDGDDDIASYTKKGDDTWIDAGQGSDLVKSGSGNEVIDAGGRSQVAGKKDTDIVFSGAGDDLVSNPGDNLIYDGGSGRDGLVTDGRREDYSINASAAENFDGLPSGDAEVSTGNGYNIKKNDGSHNYFVRGVEDVYFTGEGLGAAPLTLAANPTLTPPPVTTPDPTLTPAPVV